MDNAFVTPVEFYSIIFTFIIWVQLLFNYLMSLALRSVGSKLHTFYLSFGLKGKKKSTNTCILGSIMLKLYLIPWRFINLERSTLD